MIYTFTTVLINRYNQFHVNNHHPTFFEQANFLQLFGNAKPCWFKINGW